MQIEVKNLFPPIVKENPRVYLGFGELRKLFGLPALANDNAHVGGGGSNSEL